MHIICLRCFPELSVISTVNHPSMHWDSAIKDLLNQDLPIRLLHSCNPTLR